MWLPTVLSLSWEGVDGRLLPDGAVRQHGVRADLAARADVRPPAQDRPRQDRHARRDGAARVDIGILRVDHSDATVARRRMSSSRQREPPAAHPRPRPAETPGPRSATATAAGCRRPRPGSRQASFPRRDGRAARLRPRHRPRGRLARRGHHRARHGDHAALHLRQRLFGGVHACQIEALRGGKHFLPRVRVTDSKTALCRRPEAS